MNPGGDPPASDEETAALIALAGLDGIGPATLLDLHRSDGAVAAFDALRTGRPERVRAFAERMPGGNDRRRLIGLARDCDPATLLEANTAGDRRVLVADRAGYPSALLDDPAPPAVLFLRGDPTLLKEPAVAVIGTRNTTRIGREIAVELGRDLARHGVHVTSGLAQGIDGAAHEGVLSIHDERTGGEATGGGANGERRPGRPIGVIASGLDISYPRRHGPLQRRVADTGVLLGEVPVGHRPKRWRFPARNRLIAALAATVVVVESRITGGSMSTVDAAIERGRDVMAVPGHPLAPASAGTNQLIVDGAALVRGVEDVFTALGWQPAHPIGDGEPNLTSASVREAPPAGVAGDILHRLLHGPASLAELVDRLAQPMGEIASTLLRLEADGYVVSDGVWFELGVRGAAVLGT